LSFTSWWPITVGIARPLEGGQRSAGPLRRTLLAVPHPGKAFRGRISLGLRAARKAFRKRNAKTAISSCDLTAKLS
jgi:hypothetical protein